jgi:HK97 family phage major capsid protein
MNLKKLIEDKNTKIEEMNAILTKLETENRAEMTEDEKTSFDTLETEIRALSETITRLEKARSFEIKAGSNENKKGEVEERAIAEERVFADYIRGVVTEQRADVNMTTGDNGAIIPSTIANKIIKKLYDISPIYQRATRYNVGGTLSIPYYDESTQAITMGYASEFTAAESTSGKFTNIELKGYLARALSKVSKSLVNNSNFDIVNFVINAMAETIARFIEKELLKGTTDKIAGLSGVTQKITAASATVLTADEIIKLKDLVKDTFQQNAIFIMSSATRTAIRLLKDANDRYLLQDDINSPFGNTLFGKPVYVSDNMDDMAAGKTAIFYGDMSGLAVKVSEEVNIQVLREKYADEHAVGVLAFVEMDSKVENAQKIAKLVMAAA